MKRPLDEGGEEEEGNCGAPKRQRGEGPKVDLRVLIQSKVSCIMIPQAAEKQNDTCLSFC